MLTLTQCGRDRARTPASPSLWQDEKGWTGVAPSTCTLIESNASALKKGTKILYYGQVNENIHFQSSEVLLDDGARNTAINICAVDLDVSTETCAFYAGMVLCSGSPPSLTSAETITACGVGTDLMG
jgi:hypothetical protein